MRAALILFATVSLAFVGTAATAASVQGPSLTKSLVPAGAAASEVQSIDSAEGGVEPAFRSGAAIPPQAEEQAGSPWEISLTPYFWFSGLEGDVGVFPRIPPVQVDLSFGDVLDNLKIAAMVAATVRKDRFVAVADITYVDLGTSRDVGIRDPSFLNISLETQTVSSTLALGYRALDQEPTSVDLLAGARISSVDVELALNGPVRSLVADSGETWVDPIVGARALVPLGRRWMLTAYGDVGGFGVSSDVTWQLLGTVQFAVGPNWNLAAGWRHYVVDYEEGAFLYDVTMSGPVVGARINF